MTTETVAPATGHEPDLRGQIVVVIGGSAGIGLETARRARAEGAEVILTGRNPDRLRNAAAELDALSTVTREARPDWDLGAPGLRDAWNAGDLSPFDGWDKRAAASPSAA